MYCWYASKEVAGRCPAASSNGSIGCAFTPFELAAGQRPATSLLAYQQYMPVLLADDGCAYFHGLPGAVVMKQAWNCSVRAFAAIALSSE